MEGLEISVVKFSEMKNENGELRIEAEYFSKTNLKLLTSLKNYGCIPIFNVANSVTDGIHTSIDYDENSSINLISAGSPKENVFDLSRSVFISEKAHKENPRTALRKNDVVISTVGTIGNCAVVDESILPANSDRHVGIVRLNVEKYSPYVLSTFLLSKYGRMQTLRESTGNVQLSLFLYKVRELLIPNFSETFQSQIESLVKSAHAKLEESKSLYSQAEDLLLGELGLKDWQPKNTLHTTKKFSDFAQSGRLDAEYYQPKYDEIEKELARFEQIKIKDFINYPVSSGSTPKAGDSQYYADCNDGIPFLRAVDIVESRIDTSDLIYIKKDVHNGLLKRTQLKKGDVLFSIAGTVGRCGIFDYDFEANINQAIAILRFEETKLKHLYVVQFFNSRIGQLIIQKYARQGLQTNLNLDELSNLPIPILPEAIQTKIATLIQQSFECKAQSKQLLEDAKRMVEEEIEK